MGLVGETFSPPFPRLGLAHTADAAFALSTSVPAGVETADAPTGSRSLLEVR